MKSMTIHFNGEQGVGKSTASNAVAKFLGRYGTVSRNNKNDTLVFTPKDLKGLNDADKPVK